MNDSFKLSSDYKLTKDQIEEYQQNGHILLKDIFSEDEIKIYRNAISEIMKSFAKDKPDLKQRDTYGKAFLQKGNLWRISEQVKSFVFSKRLAKIATQLSKANGIRLYHDQALYKEPEGGITPWHQDQHYWPLDTSQTLTMWMPLIDISEEMGTLNFVSASHKEGYLGDIPISDESEKHFHEYIEAKNLHIEKSGNMKVGDATFHNGWTLHSAGSNNSNTLREVMTIIYYPSETKLLKPDNKNREFDFEALYKNNMPGELAASELTPILYQE